MSYTTTINGVSVKITKSNKKDKKLKGEFINPNTNLLNRLHFGYSGMEHYNDKTKLLDKSLNHFDKQRRNNFRSRHNCDNKPKNKITSGILSCNILW